MNCARCFQIILPACPAQLIINAGLIPNTIYRWEITDKFGHIYNNTTQSHADTGILYIDIENNINIPKGLFMSFSGSFIMKIFTYESEFQITPASFDIDDTNYDCIELLFKDYKPDSFIYDPDAPVYIPSGLQPIEVGFIDQLSVTVTHNLGYKPFVEVIDLAGKIIDCDVQHTDNNEFIVTFIVTQSGTIIYR